MENASVDATNEKVSLGYNKRKSAVGWFGQLRDDTGGWELFADGTMSQVWLQTGGTFCSTHCVFCARQRNDEKLGLFPNSSGVQHTEVVAKTAKREEYQTLIEREIGLLLYAASPLIMPVSAFIKSTRGPMLVMPRMATDLKGYIQGVLGMPTMKNRYRVLGFVFQAIEHLHTLQIAHLDIKPENVMLTHIDGGVRLCDLGLSLAHTALLDRSRLEQPDQIRGTNGWRSPEMTRKWFCRQSDIYSAALTAFATLIPGFNLFNPIYANSGLGTLEGDLGAGLSVEPSQRPLASVMAGHLEEAYHTAGVTSGRAWTAPDSSPGVFWCDCHLQNETVNN